MPQRICLAILTAGLLYAISLGGHVSTTTAADKEPAAEKPALHKFMRAKLASSQSILEGLVIEDFDKVGRGAKALLLLTTAEEWSVSEDSLYKQHSEEFRRVVRQVNKAAEQKNLDAASLSFMQVTMSCIECHRYVRTEMIAGK